MSGREKEAGTREDRRPERLDREPGHEEPEGGEQRDLGEERDALPKEVPLSRGVERHLGHARLGPPALEFFHGFFAHLASGSKNGAGPASAVSGSLKIMFAGAGSVPAALRDRV